MSSQNASCVWIKAEDNMLRTTAISMLESGGRIDWHRVAAVVGRSRTECSKRYAIKSKRWVTQTKAKSMKFDDFDSMFSQFDLNAAPGKKSTARNIRPGALRAPQAAPPPPLPPAWPKNNNIFSQQRHSQSSQQSHSQRTSLTWKCQLRGSNITSQKLEANPAPL